MSIYNVKLVKKETVANGTMAFHFEKPKDFTYRAGQFAEITLLNPPETDDEGNTRAFSLITTNDDTDLAIATRMRDSAFKRSLKDLPIGTEIKLDAPYGDFTLHKTEATPAVFLIGGIGITPIHSMIAQATKDKTAHSLTLLYSNRTPGDAAFLDDFTKLANDNPHFTFVPVMTEATPEEWNGENGYINKEMLARYVPDLTAPIYYLSGPATMVAAMRTLLIEAGISEDSIKTEEFSGY